MPFCSACGKCLQEGSKFRPECGTSLSDSPSQPIPPLSAPLRWSLSNRGGWLAVKGFLIAIILGTILVGTTHSNSNASAVAMMVAFGGVLLTSSAIFESGSGATTSLRVLASVLRLRYSFSLSALEVYPMQRK